MEPSPIKLHSTKKQKTGIDLKRCLFCQSLIPTLSKASEKGLATFLKLLRSAHINGEKPPLFDELKNVIKIEGDTWSITQDIYWHRSCYASFTSSEHIARTQAKIKPCAQSKPENRQKRDTFDWKTLCMFCCQKSYKQDKQLIKVSTFEFCQTLERSAGDRNDHTLQCRVGDFSKLIALEARYHKTCHSSYLLKARPRESTKSPHDIAIDKLMDEIKPDLEKGVALGMDVLLKRYQHFLLDNMSLEDAQKYTRQKLKLKLESKYDHLVSVYHVASAQSADIVVSKTLDLSDVINTFAKLRQSFKDMKTENELSIETEPHDISPQVILYHAALMLRGLIHNCAGIQVRPLDPSDISLEMSSRIVPDNLYTFLHWMVAPKPATSLDDIDKGVTFQNSPDFHRSILALGQDIVHIGTKGRCKTPKHVALGVSVHQATQSKSVVKLLHKHGHSISYEDVMRIDTCWADNQLQNNVCVPVNMVPGRITRGAGDNFNRATESLDGVHHDVVNMVLYQEDTDEDQLMLHPRRPQPKPSHARTIPKPMEENAGILACPNLAGKQPGPVHLYGKVQLEWFLQCTDAHRIVRKFDDALHLLRMMPLDMFDEIMQRNLIQQVPGWSAFHSAISNKPTVSKTNIGYCPMLPASATEFNTVYTMMKYFQRACEALGQQWTYITYDEAIYCKAQMIMWRNPEEFANDILEMGGMHRAMNFMGDIGRIMEESGFEDVVIEANVYGPSVVHNILRGKSYNRGLRLHKLMYESMMRLKWKAMGQWLTEQHHLLISAADKQNIVQKTNDVLLQLSGEPDRQQLNEAFESFIEGVQSLNDLLNQFTMYGRASSNLFRFWDNYGSDYVQLLLDYIAAKRDDKKDLELETFAEMIAIDFVCGHQNYARWGTIAVCEGHLLKAEKPDIYAALSSGHGSVHHTKKPFNAVWHDMGIEQSINKDCGKHRQLCTKEGALNKYYLTAHYKACVTNFLWTMSGMKVSSEDSSHNEATKSRIQRDEEAVQSITKVISDRMLNPFVVEVGSSEDNKQPLVNIATSSVATKEITENLCNIRKEGEKQLSEFVQHCLITGEKDFFDPITKPKLMTFSKMNKKVVNKQKQAVQSVNIDRMIFSKLTIVAQSRDIDLSGLLKFELAPVPLSLFNLDGSMRKTAKNVAMEWLKDSELSIQRLPPLTEKTLLVVDFMMLLRMVCTDSNNCKTFGELSDTLLSSVLSQQSDYVAVVGDSYAVEDSIKCEERSRRGRVEMQEIRNPTRSTPLPKQKMKMMSNPKNKSNTANFLMEDWTQQCSTTLPAGKQLFLVGGFKNPAQAKIVMNGFVRDVVDLESDQEEADSRMFLVIRYIMEKINPQRIILWSMDTDVAILCPRYCILLGIPQFYLKTGTKAKKRFLPIHHAIVEIGHNVSMVLPILHGLSGCDSTSAFSGLGKKTWMKVLLENPELIPAIMRIGESRFVLAECAVQAATKLVCCMYGKPGQCDLDKVRYELFVKKKLASDRLPPTSDAFHQHLKRVNHQCFIWLHATERYLEMPPPQENGWMLDDQLHPVYMTQPSAPESLLQFTECKCTTGCSTRRCKCKKESIFCTDACGCDEEFCLNRMEIPMDSDSDSESTDED